MVPMQHAPSTQFFLLGDIQETTETPYAPTDAPLAFSGLTTPCKTRSKHAHPCRPSHRSNPSISTKPPIPTASSLETWWKRNNLAGMGSTDDQRTNLFTPPLKLLPNLTARWKREALRVPASVEMETKTLGCWPTRANPIPLPKAWNYFCFFFRVIILLQLPQKLCLETLHDGPCVMTFLKLVVLNATFLHEAKHPWWAYVTTEGWDNWALIPSQMKKVVKIFKQMHWQQNKSIKDDSAWGLLIGCIEARSYTS